MKTILFLASTLLLFFTANAQEPFATIELKSGNEVIAFDGGNTENAQKEIRRKGRSTTNSNFGFITLDGGTLLYYSQSGEIEKLDIKDIKEVKIDSKKYNNMSVTMKATQYETVYTYAKIESDQITLLPLPVKKNMIRMQQKITENEKYLLTNLFSNGINYFYIYDKENNLVEKQIIHSLTKKKNEKAIEIVKQYFGDCENLIKRMEENTKNAYGKGIQTQYFLLMTIDEEKNTSKATNYITDFNCN